jgi:hypothetical protein
MENKEYFYLNGETKVGPLTFEALKYSPITPATLVWHNTLPDWVEARSLPEFAGFFPPENVPPPPVQNFNATNAYNNPDKPPMPENYLIVSIIVTILCCWPIGIASIVNAAKVSSAYNAGDYEGAKKASANAKKWAIWTVVAGLIFLILDIIIAVVIGLSAAALDGIFG